MQKAFVWAGGAVFVLSLAVAVFLYVVHFQARTPWGGWTPVAIDVALFSVFAAHHSVFARESVKRRLTAIPATVLRSVYVWTASLLLILVCVAWQPIGGVAYDMRGTAAAGLVAVQVAGIWLIARAVGKIDPLELAGIRTPGRGDAAPRESLQVTGPYRIVRHPLYLGWFLATFATSRMTGDRLAFAIVTALYLIVAVPWEERALLQSFGSEYVRYKEQVRWRIVPYVY